jgi:riboflavin kinase/FMN adenylyltransferase
MIHVGTILPSDGVYAGLVHLADGTTRAAAISVGANPTFDAVDRTLEAHLLDFDEDIYGMRIEVVSLRRIRGMTKFAGATELIESIGRDVDRTRDLVAHLVQAPLPR